MTVWITVIKDHHSDVDALPFTSMPAAFACARDWVRDARDVVDVELNEWMVKDGCVLWLGYGSEGDYARVVERELDGPIPS